MSKTIVYVYIILDFPITYRNASECVCLNKTVNSYFLFKSDENTYPKGRAILYNVQSCRSIEKREFLDCIVITASACRYFETS